MGSGGGFLGLGGGSVSKPKPPKAVEVTQKPVAAKQSVNKTDNEDQNQIIDNENIKTGADIKNKGKRSLSKNISKPSGGSDLSVGSKSGIRT